MEQLLVVAEHIASAGQDIDQLGSEACNLEVEKLRMGHADRAVEAGAADHRLQTAAAMVVGPHAHTQRVQARMLESGQRPE